MPIRPTDTRYYLDSDSMDMCCDGWPLVWFTLDKRFKRDAVYVQCNLCGDHVMGPTEWQAMIKWNKRRRDCI